MKRYALPLPCLLALFLFAMTSCTESTPTGPLEEIGTHAGKKPDNGGGKPGGEDPAPVGTVFFFGLEEVPAVGGSNYATDPDGKGRTDMQVTGEPGIPSYDLHGGGRWFLTVRDVQGTYPDGDEPRQEIFLEKEGGAVPVRLTDEVDLVVSTSGTAWLPGDAGVSFRGRRISAEPVCTDAYIEGGIYTLPVLFNGEGEPSPDGPATLLVAAPAGNCSPDISQAVWSPDGDSLAYADQDGNLLVAAMDIASGLPLQPTVLTDGYPTSWSVNGEILFTSYGQIHRIGSGGSGETMLLDAPKARFLREAMWSPDGNHFIYQNYSTCRGATCSSQFLSSEVYRADRDGSNRVNLARDLEWAEPTGWR